MSGERSLNSLTIIRLSGMTAGFPEEVLIPSKVYLKIALAVYQEC